MKDMDTSAATVLRELRRIAPEIAFSIYWDIIPNPVPLFVSQEALKQVLDKGYREYQVTVTAVTVQNGQVFEASTYMTGFFMKPDDRDWELRGWLPEMLYQTANDLKYRELKEVEYDSNVSAAIKYLGKLRPYAEAVRRQQSGPMI